MSKIKNSFLKDVVHRAECIPLRLTSAERELLTILQGALDVSEYTENVDVSQNDFFARSRYDKHVTILAQIDELLATLIGLNATSGDKITTPGTVSLMFEDGSGAVVAMESTVKGAAAVVDPFPSDKP